jgi:ubiquinol-cytochrome c reductase cytochrome b subunit
VLLLLASILLLIIIPFIISYEVRNTNFKPVLRFVYYYFLFNCIILGWIGAKDIITPFYEIGQISTIFYFSYFLLILPLIHKKI